eukprot:187744-Rhodomonas_salina.1
MMSAPHTRRRSAVRLSCSSCSSLRVSRCRLLLAPCSREARFPLLTCLLSQISDDQSTLVAGDWEITASNSPDTVNWVYTAASGCAGAFKVTHPLPALHISEWFGACKRQTWLASVSQRGDADANAAADAVGCASAESLLQYARLHHLL